MSDRKHILVLADSALESAELLDEIEREAARQPLRTFLLLPSTATDQAPARNRLHRVIERLAARGLWAIGVVGSGGPLDAVITVWGDAFYDEIIIAASATEGGDWDPDLAQKVQRLTTWHVRYVTVGSEST